MWNWLPMKRNVLAWLLVAALGWFGCNDSARGAITVFSTGFEYSEGYTNTLDLAGQNAWTSYGSGGNGIVAGVFAGQGQQAYIGFAPPDTNIAVLSVWRPINLDPVPAATPIVKFSVLMEIEDSSNGEYDYFDWSVYNAQGKHLFTIDFDNYWLEVNYSLNGTNQFTGTGVTYTNSTPYTLAITMDFGRGRWSATLDNMLLATNQPITTTSDSANLGDVDAEWFLYTTNAPGDNFMVFDNYQVTRDSLAPTQPTTVKLLATPTASLVPLRLFGQTNYLFALDYSTNLVNWTALKTNIATQGYFDVNDTPGPNSPRRFYRGRWVP
jgi:hypothetical protein